MSFLRASPGWWSTTEIANQTGQRLDTTRPQLRRAEADGAVSSRNIDGRSKERTVDTPDGVP